ncbi:MAG: hypothetical protein ACI8Z5_002655 [Lentimonas sp.]|jgi:hypothetical protein
MLGTFPFEADQFRLFLLYFTHLEIDIAVEGVGRLIETLFIGHLSRARARCPHLDGAARCVSKLQILSCE